MYVCPWTGRARLCCLLVDGRVEFAAITAHQPANCSKRAASRHVRASQRYSPASCGEGAKEKKSNII